MNQIKHYADVQTPVPGSFWLGLDSRQRLDNVRQALEGGPRRFITRVQVIAAKEDGQVTLHMSESLPADQRGLFLLDLEEFLKETIDPAITVWLELLGDRNSLRNLRGIEVKAS
jgi:hypothetical protein